MSIYDPDCRLCPLSEGPRAARKHVCVPGDGPAPAEIMLVGEALGAQEETEGRPFVGQAGQLLDDVLRQAGLARSDVFISNMCRCRPPNNRAPTQTEMAACMVYTIRELAHVRPQVIVCLGASALKGMTGQKNIGTNRGKVLHLKPEYRSGVPVIATFHPAASLHNPAARGQNIAAMVQDLQLAQRIIGARNNDATIFNIEGEKIHIVSGLDESETRKALREIHAEAEDIASDGEWTVLAENRRWPWSRRDGEGNTLFAVGLAGRVRGGIVAVSVPVAGVDRDPAIERAVRRILESHPSIYHQATADLLWYLARGWYPILGGDTLLLGSLLNLDSSLSLEALCSLLTSMPPGWKGEMKDAKVGKIGQMPITEDDWRSALDYNARDCIGTLVLHDAEIKRAYVEGRKKMLTLYRKVLLPSTEYLARASLVGAPVDLEYLGRLERSARRTISRLVQEIGTELGIHSRVEEIVLNPNRLGPVLVERGFSLPLTEKTKKPSVTLDALTLNKDKPGAAKLISLSKMEKLEGTYLAPWHRMISDQGDERLHTIFKLWQARTGRSSAEVEEGGTIQQAPHSAKIRKVVRARNGRKVLSADLSMIEIRIAAWLANERTMLKFLTAGIDIHKALAGWLKEVSRGTSLDAYLRDLEHHIAQVTPEERYEAKPPNFGLLYGGSEQVLIRLARLSYGITMTQERATEMKRGYFEMFSDLTRWHAENETPVPYVETAMGRRRYVEDDASDPSARGRKQVNTPVQAMASDLAMLGGIVQAGHLIRDEGLLGRAELFAFIHDAVMYEYDAEIEEQLSEIVKYSMEHPRTEELFGFKIPVPIVAEVTTGEWWS